MKTKTLILSALSFLSAIWMNPFHSMAQIQEICLVTVDPVLNKNIIVWEKGIPAASYNIYRDIIGVYDSIGNVPFDSLSSFTDLLVAPDVTSYRYKISTIDSLGVESPLSAFHKTIQLMLNLGIPPTVNLMWDGYEGFAFFSYNIWRGTDCSNMAIIDSVPASSSMYTDPNPPVGDCVFYMIEVVSPAGCTATKMAVFYGSAFSNVPVIDNTGNGCACGPSLPNLVQGNVYNEINLNCIFDSSDYGLQGKFIQVAPGNLYAITDAAGNYSIRLDSGNYTFSLLDNDPYRSQVCPVSPTTYSLSLGSVPNTVSNIDFAMQVDLSCTDMNVDISTWAIRPCFTSTYTVSYCNNGTLAATNATVEVTLEANMTYSGTTGILLSQNGSVLTFDVGTLNPGQCSTFNLQADVACDFSLLGSTMCVDAHIYPDSSCAPPDSAWDKSSVSVEGSCVSDSLACFTITNTGDPGNGDMQGASEYRIYENNMLVSTGTFQLNGGDSVIICWPSGNNTIRLEADQRPGHPGNSNPQDNVELCGDSLSNFVTNQITLTPPDDADNFIDVDCRVVTGSFDPNDKQVIPAGLTDTYHYIDSTDELEYRVRFQNTGTDTAFKVVIYDTISSYLDITTIRRGVGSHVYTLDILGSDVLQITFDNILLPDSNINEPQSHGFVKFKIQQRVGNVLGTVIENKAGIVFDFNPAIITNTVFNTIGDIDAITINVPTLYDDEYSISIYPNPFNSFTTFEIEGIASHLPLTFQLYNVIGKRVMVVPNILEGKFVVNREYLPAGIYIYSITAKDGLIGTGKLIIE